MTITDLAPATDAQNEVAADTQTEICLTRREKVVLSNLSEEITLEEVANRLFVTRNTVKSQVRSVYRKIGVSTRADAVAWAREAGIPRVVGIH